MLIGLVNISKFDLAAYIQQYQHFIIHSILLILPHFYRKYTQNTFFWSPSSHLMFSSNRLFKRIFHFAFHFFLKHLCHFQYFSKVNICQDDHLKYHSFRFTHTMHLLQLNCFAGIKCKFHIVVLVSFDFLYSIHLELQYCAAQWSTNVVFDWTGWNIYG